jgi:hypothetical protein
MSKYTFPNLSSFEVIFNGRRYKAFKVSKSNPFKDTEEYADFVIWDGLYDAQVAHGIIQKKEYIGFLSFSHVEIQVETATDINGFVKNASKAQLRFFRDMER